MRPHAWEVTLTNHMVQRYGDLLVSPSPVTMTTASLLVDAQTYEGLQEGAFYTVETVIDRNPWHRQGAALRERLWWTFRKRVLRRHLIETVKVTVPNCQLTGTLDEASRGA